MLRASLCLIAASAAAIHLPCAPRASRCTMAAKRKRPPPPRPPPKGFGTHRAHGGSRLLHADYDALCAWLAASPSASLDRVAIGEFGGMRGVMAVRDIAAGEEIVSIPAHLAVDLGAQSVDPLAAARRLLAARATDGGAHAAYWRLLPQEGSADLCTPDFMSDEQLRAVQWPPLVAQTRERAQRLRAAPSGGEGGGFSERELRWAVWIVLSRVLTVLGPDGQGHKLLIPFLDMFNHKASSKHYLTGRTDGLLRVVAGEKVRSGEQVYIVYGDAQTSNVEFLSHYGFIDPAAGRADRAVVRANPEAVHELRLTTLEDDLAYLDANPNAPYKERLAIELRVALKKAAMKEGLL
ncbi:hypothetical protein AB1Y20_001746 [Prymnesium parvum]|uniref:SET domain-containing protein n=1 Tax=Prymnesium parvum TaxID=97485 RepID=A0AB34KC93_PRYPA